jgi:hypothetical protein
MTPNSAWTVIAARLRELSGSLEVHADDGREWTPPAAPSARLLLDFGEEAQTASAPSQRQYEGPVVATVEVRWPWNQGNAGALTAARAIAGGFRGRQILAPVGDSGHLDFLYSRIARPYAQGRTNGRDEDGRLQINAVITFNAYDLQAT